MTRPWVLVALAFAAVVVIVQNVLFWTGDDAPVAMRTGASSAVPSATPADEHASLETVPAARALGFVRALGAPEAARNPFLTRREYESLLAGRASVQRAEDVGPPALDGTLTSRDRRVAWLDGRPFSEGDLVGGFELLRIEEKAVELRDDARHLRLEIEPAPAAPDFWDGEDGLEGDRS